MNAKDLSEGLMVAIDYDDGRYYPVKAEVISIGGFEPDDHDYSFPDRPPAKSHRVRISNGMDKGKYYKLVGKRILHVWSEQDEKTFQDMKNAMVAEETLMALAKQRKEQETKAIDNCVVMLERLGIFAVRSASRTSGNTDALSVFDAIEMEKILQTYTVQNMFKLKGDNESSPEG